MARRANAGERIGPVLAQPIGQLVVAVSIATPVAALGGAEVVFGGRLSGQGGLVALAALSGAAMGVCNLISASLTAQARIIVQVISYGMAGVVAVFVSYAFKWSITGLYVGQILGCVLAVALLLARVALPDRAGSRSRLAAKANVA